MNEIDTVTVNRRCFSPHWFAANDEQISDYVRVQFFAQLFIFFPGIDPGVAIARATEAKIVITDEPLTDNDPGAMLIESPAEIFEALRKEKSCLN